MSRRALPLGAFLTRLIWLCVLPLLLLTTWLAWHHVQGLRAEHDREAQRLARNFASAIDQHLDARLRALNMLALSPLLDDAARWRELYREAQGFQAAFGSHVILADVGAPMRMLFNTRVPYGDPLPPLPRPKGRAAAPTALATARPAVGDTFFGPVAKQTMVALAVPALRDRRVAYILLTTYETRLLQRRLDQVALPAGWALALLDGQGQSIARRGPPGQTQTGRRFVVPSARSPWSVVLEIPREAHQAPLQAVLTYLGLGILGATLAGVLGGTLAGRRLARQVASLATPPGPDTPAPSIVEIAAARRLLDEAQARTVRDAAALKESELRFHAIFDGLLDAIVFADTERRVRLVNPAFSRLFGYSAEEVAGRTTEFLYADPADYADQGRRRYRVPPGGEAGAFEMRYRRKDGELFWAESSGGRIIGPDGALLGFIDMHRDIGARRRAEAQLRLWAQSFEHANFGLAISDARSNTILAVNPAFARERGYRPEELAGQPVMTVFPADRWEDIRATLAALDRTDHGVFESEHARRDGSRFPVLLDITVIRDAEGRANNRVAYALDISARRQAERELAEARERALETQMQARVATLNQMEDANAARAEILRLNADLERRVQERTAELSAANQELDSFAYAVSHDLRAPLRAMSGFSRALIEDYGAQLRGDARTWLEQIGLASRRMGELIDGILALSRSTRGELRRDTVDISALATRLLDDLARAEPERRVAVEVRPGLLATGDARMLEAALANLLANAWKYTGRASAPSIRLYAENRAGLQWYCVADNGAGFDMAHAARLFQPFQRLHRQDEFPGIGIGLATVQRIIHRHGGQIEARGEPDRGATFCFTLPDDITQETAP